MFQNPARQGLEQTLAKAGVNVAATSTSAQVRGSFDEHITILVTALLTIAGLVVAVGGLGLATTMSVNVLEQKQSPLHRLEHALQPYVNLLVLPIFALFNAGLPLSGVGVGTVTLGVSVGLIVGKPLGVFLASFVAVKTGLASLPTGVTWRDLFGVGLLAGIGFTMSLFIAGLSFESDLYNQARLGIIVASLVSAGLGIALLASGQREATAH